VRLFAALLLVGVVACSEDAPVTDRVVSFNYCGNVCAAGGDGGADAVVAMVAEHDAIALLLQEVCRTQAMTLRDRLGEELGTSDVHYVTTFAEDRGGLNQCVGDDYGMAIIAPVVEAPVAHPLPNPGLGAAQLDERAVICADVGPFTACTTHLVRARNDPEAHRQQVAAFIDLAAELADGAGAVVLAGDLNERPSAFSPLALRGDWVTAPNTDIDQVFATSADFRSARVDAVPCDCSDHEALVIGLVRR
jgi:endonuclease/exonuclease/phosphatase family metal-dependent hydrolase